MEAYISMKIIALQPIASTKHGNLAVRQVQQPIACTKHSNLGVMYGLRLELEQRFSCSNHRGILRIVEGLRGVLDTPP